MKKSFLALLVLALLVLTVGESVAQTYYYEGGSISSSDLRRARPYKKGSYLLQGSKKGIIWIPKHDYRGQRYLELVLEHMMQGGVEIRDYTGVQIRSIIGGSHGTASVLALLMDAETREILGINKEQGEKINEIGTQFRQELHERMLALAQKNPKMSASMVALARASETERLSVPLRAQLENVLLPSQFRRAQEIVFQMYGGFDTAVVDLDILSLFDLTREQREKLELVAEDANQRRNRIINDRTTGLNTAADIQTFDGAITELAPLIAQKVRNVLTEEQRKRGDDLMAKAVEVQKQLGLTE